MTDIHQQKLLIIDFGSQYTHLIARRVREIGLFCEIYPWNIDPQRIRDFSPNGIIFSGGPESVHAENAPVAPEMVYDLGVPILGVCYGLQLIARHYGARVSGSERHEYGYARVEVIAESGLLDGLSDHEGCNELDVWMSHGDQVDSLPEGFVCVAQTETAPFAAIMDQQRRVYGLQFHPEVTHTKQGEIILTRFIRDICGCDTEWTASHIVDDAIERIRQQVGSDHVLLGLSGGVDSSVVAALLHRAIGDQLTCIFVDTGLLRYQEGDQVMATMAEHMGVRVERVNAQQRFYDGLAGLTDPEDKRKKIGGLFIEIFEEAAQRHNDASWLAQGTIYPDVIESAAAQLGTAHVIKSHHNVGGLPEKMNLKLLEPLRELFKDEVRRVGLELGLPREMVFRHPFPGPGLGVRILGEVNAAFADILARADHIFIEELRKAELYDQVSQAFAVFLPVKSVGVVGDARSYDYVIALRCVETIDFMTAKWSELPYDLIGHVANRIINEVRGISRVVYDVSGKPPATIEWE